MKKIFQAFNKFIFCFCLIECFLLTNSSNAFFPVINEPSEDELESTSIQIGKTAIQLIQFGQYDEAIKLLELSIKLNPKEYALWISLAEAQIRSDKKNQALLSLNKALEISPKDQSIYFTKASIYMDLNNPKKAKNMIEKGLLINKNSDRGYFQLGNAEILLNNYQSAIIAFKESSKINANYWQSINNEGLILYELNNRKEAIKKFELALKISNNAEPMLALAIVLFSIDNKSIESIRLAKNAIKSNPQYISRDYQAKQLWGRKLQKSAQKFFNSKEMKKVVREAKEKTQ